MYLEETPYIKLRYARGLLNIDYTSCDIIFNENHAGARSYNTIIGVYAIINGKKYYFETSGVYSQTTAGKHKPRARDIAIYNGFEVIENIKPDILFDLYFKSININALFKELQQKEDLIKYLKLQDYKTCHQINSQAAWDGLRIYDLRQLIKNSETNKKETIYKNGNTKTVKQYRTKFNYLSDLYYKITSRSKKTTIKAAAQLSIGATPTKDTTGKITTYKAVISSY